MDHFSRVYRNPGKFGKVVIDGDRYTVHVTLFGHGMSLTSEEKECMGNRMEPIKKWDQKTRPGTSKHDFVDVTEHTMGRCPL